jgi:hypothetical protein
MWSKGFELTVDKKPVSWHNRYPGIGSPQPRPACARHQGIPTQATRSPTRAPGNIGRRQI